METLTRVRRTRAEILDLDFYNHVWPFVSWPVLSDHKKFPHSTLLYTVLTLGLTHFQIYICYCVQLYLYNRFWFSKTNNLHRHFVCPMLENMCKTKQSKWGAVPFEAGQSWVRDKDAATRQNYIKASLTPTKIRVKKRVSTPHLAVYCERWQYFWD